MYVSRILIFAFAAFVAMYSSAQSLFELSKSASAGNPEAQYQLAIKCLYGEGLPQDSVKAFKYFHLSAEQKYAPAMKALGNAYRDGDGVEQDWKQSTAFFEKAAEGGDVQAMMEAALNYGNLQNPDWSSSKAKEWYQKAAEAGNDEAKVILAKYNLRDYGNTNNKKLGFQQLKDYAAQGNTFAMYELGEAYYAGHYVEKDRMEAAKWYRKAAEAGNAKAMNAMAYCYDNGKGVPMDAEQVRYWYVRSAEAGNITGQYKAGRCFQKGIGGEVDLGEAMKWYFEGAEQNSASCIMKIGEAYLTGKGLEKNVAKGISFLRRAAQLGNGRAFTILGDCCSEGIGLKQDKDEALRMYTEAYEHGDRAGGEALARMLEDRYQEFQKRKERGEELKFKITDPTSVWHDIVRWQDEDSTKKLKPNPLTGSYETEEDLTY